MGNGMMIVVDEADADTVLNVLSIEAKIVGSIIKDKKIIIDSKGADAQKLVFEL